MSAGWTGNAGEVDGNGLTLTEGFDVSVFIKGDQTPVSLCETQLLLSYAEVEVHEAAQR